MLQPYSRLPSASCVEWHILRKAVLAGPWIPHWIDSTPEPWTRSMIRGLASVFLFPQALADIAGAGIWRLLNLIGVH